MPIETERGLRVTVSFGQRRVLLMLSERAGRVELNVSKLNQEVRDGIRGLANLLLITVTPLIGTDREVWKLTDLGAQVVDQMKITNQSEVISAQADENFQAMMGNGTTVCPSCSTDQKVANSRLVPHTRMSKVTEDGFSTFKVARCPGSGGSV